LDYGIRLACEKDHVDIVRFLIRQGARKVRGFEAACRKAGWNTIQFFINRGMKNWNLGLINACRGNQTDVAHFMIKQGANNYIEALSTAVSNHKVEVALFMIKHMVHNVPMLVQNNRVAIDQIDCFFVLDILDAGGLTKEEFISFFGEKGVKAINDPGAFIAEAHAHLCNPINKI